MPEWREISLGIGFWTFRSLVSARDGVPVEVMQGWYVKVAMRQSIWGRESMEESNKQIHSKESEDKLLNHRAAWAFLESEPRNCD